MCNIYFLGRERPIIAYYNAQNNELDDSIQQSINNFQCQNQDNYYDSLSMPRIYRTDMLDEMGINRYTSEYCNEIINLNQKD